MLVNIKRTFTPKPAILAQAMEGRQAKWNIFLNGLAAFGVGIGAIYSELIVMIPYFAVAAIAFHGNVSETATILAQLAATVVPIILLPLYVRFVEKRSLRTMGFVKEHAVTDYLLGMVIAFAMFSACVGICAATGAMTFGGYVLNGQYLSLALLFLGFLVQGASEETVCRGFMMTSFGSKGGAFAGMLFNSLVFGCLHLFNSGITALSFVNLILFGVFMSFLVLKLNSIWMACAIHSVWNFVQGNFFGILVSGGSFGASVFRFDSVGGKELLNGGDFGMEGGLATTVILTVSIMIVLLIKPREPENAQEQMPA
jgi:Predicted metal-dependent membrane protease